MLRISDAGGPLGFWRVTRRKLRMQAGSEIGKSLACAREPISNGTKEKII